MVFLDEFPDVWSDRGTIEAHHEQLPLHHMRLANRIAARVEEVTHHCPTSW
jgi:hypothetical protein